MHKRFLDGVHHAGHRLCFPKLAAHGRDQRVAHWMHILKNGTSEGKRGRTISKIQIHPYHDAYRIRDVSSSRQRAQSQIRSRIVQGFALSFYKGG
jgi:hypothetical protein